MKTREIIRLLIQILFLILFVVLYAQNSIRMWIVVFGVGVLLSLIFSRLYCGWICPIETLFRPVGWIKSKLTEKKQSRIDSIRYGWLRWIILMFLVITMVLSRRLGLEINGIVYITILAVLVLLILSEIDWHRVFCPYSAVLSFSSKPGLFAMEIDMEKCKKCGLCKKECPADCIIIENEQYKIVKNECLVCFRCQKVCRFDAVGYRKVKS